MAADFTDLLEVMKSEELKHGELKHTEIEDTEGCLPLWSLSLCVYFRLTGR